MPENKSFQTVIRRIRTGNSEAIKSFVARYEPIIRLEIKLRVRDDRLYRQFESGDICQSVLASFLIRTAAGQFEIVDQEHLAKLLITMTRRKVASYARRHQTKMRDYRRAANENVDGLVDRDHSPSQIVANDELVREFRHRLTREERLIADFRADGLTWPEIAEKVGGIPQSLRSTWSRTVRRVAKELGIGGEDAE